MILRKHHLLALFAALGVLLHAGLAAAQVFCAMSGTLSTSCCCPKAGEADGPVLKSADDCCRQALAAPSFDLQQQQPPLQGPALAPDWLQVVFAAPAEIPARIAPVPTGTSPPLLGLQTIVIVR